MPRLGISSLLALPLALAGCAPDTGVIRRPDLGLDTGAPDTDPTGPSTEPPIPGDTEACFLGPDRDHDLCYDLFALDPVPADYTYPEPYQGDPNYRAPLAFLDLEQGGTHPEDHLAPHFQLVEIAEAWKGRYAVIQPHAIERIQEVRDQLGALIVNSGYRSPGYNADIPGAATWSRHMYGDAFDLNPASATLGDLEAACSAAGAFVLVYTNHVHCDWRDDPVDEAFFGPAPRSVSAAPRPVLDATITWDGARLVAPAIGFDEGEPLREWFAFDAAGTLLTRHEGSSFLPPRRAVSVEVDVGRALTRGVDLRGP